jgi:type I restriction enzyme M protein
MNEEIRALADRYAAELKRNIDGRVGDIAVYGQESNYTTWKLVRMNVAIRGIDANLGLRNADSFRADLHSDLKADFMLANPPFNMSDWGGENLRQDVRWKFGMPPVNNVSYEWGQYATPCVNGREN